MAITTERGGFNVTLLDNPAVISDDHEYRVRVKATGPAIAGMEWADERDRAETMASFGIAASYAVRRSGYGPKAITNVDLGTEEVDGGDSNETGPGGEITVIRAAVECEGWPDF